MMEEEKTIRATLTSKGQIVIGSDIRRELGLEPHQKLLERIEGGRIILEPIETPEELKGSLKDMAEGKNTDELMKEVKEGWK